MDKLKGIISTNFPGCFPHISSRGMNYIYFLYDFDLNVILAEPIKSEQTAHLIEGYEACYKKLQQAGITPILQHLDNVKHQKS